MSHIRLIGSAACLSVVLAVSFLAASSGKNPMTTSENGDGSSTLFAQLDDLWSLSSLTPPHVEKVIGMRLTMTSQGAHPPAPQVFTGSATEGQFSSAELRVPTDPANSTAGLLILRLRPESALTAEQVVRRYGEASGVEPPHPGSPPDTPVYYHYAGSPAKGLLSFGVRDDHVVTVVLDRYPQ